VEKVEFIIGPCVLESKDMALDIAGKLVEDLAPFSDQIDLVFKASFNKANRTSVNSFRGFSMDQGLKIFEEVKSVYQLPTLTDYHLPDQAMELASVVDYIQVPAFLCRQTDMIVSGARACQKYNRILNVKKGQFIAPHNTQTIVDKTSGILEKSSVRLTERGTCFGYNNMIVDMASFKTMKETGVKTIYDATHSVQLPGASGSVTGAKRDQIEVLARAAVAAGADGIFMEAHPNPAESKSDATSIYELSKVKDFVEQLLSLYALRETWK